MTYFYDYFAKEYRDAHNGQILPSPEAIFRDIRHEEVKRCRDVLKNTFSHYRSGRNAEALARLLKEYREYVSCCHDEHAKNRYNALVYRYMVDVHVGSRAIAARLGVAKETALNYIDRCMDEMLVLCMGVPAAGMPGQKTKIIRMLVDGNRLLRSMAGEYVLCLFPGKKERGAVEQGRKLTRDIMVRFADAVEAYSGYCNDKHACIDTDIRKAGILEKCLAGTCPAAIAEEYGCCESTVYADIRENERRLAAMLFGTEGEMAGSVRIVK
ncbi:hypothetical protein [Roseburia sp. 1XD42-69]|uniref:hypothetical protein n=1 Tax=Roseburia sp. 1XD42-69 TaxID=2320088 RepID=UPI000EA30997|nr:hypothetical protein [Roseburia sp. 1XD42-69]RKJ64878.1 hypothetical protein D7Y06_11310 [Roseburia sp. 1XD42-69]